MESASAGSFSAARLACSAVAGWRLCGSDCGRCACCLQNVLVASDLVQLGESGYISFIQPSANFTLVDKVTPCASQHALVGFASPSLRISFGGELAGCLVPWNDYHLTLLTTHACVRPEWNCRLLLHKRIHQLRHLLPIFLHSNFQVTFNIYGGEVKWLTDSNGRPLACAPWQAQVTIDNMCVDIYPRPPPPPPSCASPSLLLKPPLWTTSISLLRQTPQTVWLDL